MKKRNAMYLLWSAVETKGIIMTAIVLTVMITTGVVHAHLTGSFVKVEAPQPVTVATFDLVFKMTLSPNDGEFVDRLDITLPDVWTINSLTAPPPSTSCPGVDTQTSRLVRQQSGKLPEGIPEVPPADSGIRVWRVPISALLSM